MTLDQYEELQAEWLATGEIEPFGAGLSKYWHTGHLDPFLIPAMIHDIDYTYQDIPLKLADKYFYQRCKNLAGSSLKLRILARLYYTIVILVRPFL